MRRMETLCRPIRTEAFEVKLNAETRLDAADWLPPCLRLVCGASLGSCIMLVCLCDSASGAVLELERKQKRAGMMCGMCPLLY
jgi:hypothetical protein